MPLAWGVPPRAVRCGERASAHSLAWMTRDDSERFVVVRSRVKSIKISLKISPPAGRATLIVVSNRSTC